MQRPHLRSCFITVSHRHLAHLPSRELIVKSLHIYLNPDHGDPAAFPPAASTWTPSPLSNRTFSPLCLPVTPPRSSESALLLRGKSPSNENDHWGPRGRGWVVDSLLLPEHVLQLERSEIYLHSPPKPPMPPSAAMTR